MTHGVLYLNLGDKHSVHLIVSLTSLRRFYAGPVAIVTNPAGIEVAQWCANDPELGRIEVIVDPTLEAGGKGKSYLCKTLLPAITPFDNTLFLDADTLIVGDFREAFPQSANEIVLTHWSDWVSTGRMMRGRIEPWANVEPDRVERMLAKPWPAINTGVVGWGSVTDKFAADWHETTARRQGFICDEIAAQLIFPDHNVRLLDWRYNASLMFDTGRADAADCRIWHGHGGKAWKSESGRKVYLPFFRDVLAQNRANVQALRLPHKWFAALPPDDQAWIGKYTGQTV